MSFNPSLRHQTAAIKAGTGRYVRATCRVPDIPLPYPVPRPVAPRRPIDAAAVAADLRRAARFLDSGRTAAGGPPPPTRQPEPPSPPQPRRETDSGPVSDRMYRPFSDPDDFKRSRDGRPIHFYKDGRAIGVGRRTK